MFGTLLTDSLIQTSLLALVVGLVAHWLIRRRRYNFPPGPTALPLIGNMLQLKSFSKLHEKAFDMSKKYGPVVTIYLGTTPVIFVNTIQTALEVLVKKSTEFANRPKDPTTDMFSEGGKDIAFGQYGPTWHLHRKLASKALRQYMQGDKLNQRIHAAMEVVVEELSKQTDAFDPEEHVNFIVAHILIGLCFGGTYKFGDPEIIDIMKAEDELLEMFNGTIIEDLVPIIQYVYKTNKFRKLESGTEVLLKIMRKKYYAEKNTFDRNSPCRHLLDNLFLAKLETEEEEGSKALESLTDTHLIQTASDIFFAGIDTSRMTIRFALLYMCAYPEIQQKVQKEIDGVVGRDRFPELADRPNLGYTEATLHEVMRLASVVPLGVFHCTSVDTDISGYKIPKGTQVAINHWGLHHDPEAWKDVNKFDPERYLGDNGKMGPKPKNWLPFSAGKRVCLGEFVAKPELHLIFATLLQQFTWSSKPGTKVDIEPQGGGLGLSPKPNQLVVERRTKN